MGFIRLVRQWEFFVWHGKFQDDNCRSEKAASLSWRKTEVPPRKNCTDRLTVFDTLRGVL